MNVSLLGTQTGEAGFTALVWRSLWQDKERAFYFSDLDEDNDGPGGSLDIDRYWQPETSLRYKGQSIDSRKVAGIVVPTWLPSRVRGIVLGCQAFVACPVTGERLPAVVYDLGPTNKSGEGSTLMCQRLHSAGGENRPLFLFEIFPGVPAVVDGVTYDLQPIH